jgi:hypothetical protein
MDNPAHLIDPPLLQPETAEIQIATLYESMAKTKSSVMILLATEPVGSAVIARIGIAAGVSIADQGKGCQGF